jgi:sugar lactone lactonase YvrE
MAIIDFFDRGWSINPQGAAYLQDERSHTFTEVSGMSCRVAHELLGPGLPKQTKGAVWLANPEGEHTVLRVREGGEITDRIALPGAHAYAVLLGGPERRQLFVCTSDTHNPVQIAQAPSATLRVLEVAVPGAGRP